MFVARAGRVAPRLSSSYIEISNYLRGRRTGFRAGGYGPRATTRPFHRSSCLLEESNGQKDDIHFLEKYKKAVEFPPATADFETFFSKAAADQQVMLHGYLGVRRDVSKKLAFVRLTDPTMKHSIQLISMANNGSLEQLKAIRANSPVAIQGKVQPKKAKGAEMEEAEPWELFVEEVHPLNDFPKDILMKSDTNFAPKHRYLQLRADPELRDALRFRAQVHNVCKQELDASVPPFLEVETPILFKSTPEGAREFLVPTRKRGLAYALPQSPQQYKQILMASGIPRYYQFARCFRDEDLRADRQPEFTQLDMEMSFATGEDVMKVIEGVIRRVWSALMPEPAPAGPFRRMGYQEAMARYGSDKPDTRYGMEISRIDYMIPVDLVNKISDLDEPIVEVFKIENNENDPAAMSQFIRDFFDSPAGAPFNNNPAGAPGVFVYDAKKPLCGMTAFGFEATEYMEEQLDLDHGDLIVIQARENAPFSGGSTPIGDLRRALHTAAITNNFKPAPTGFDFLWINDFPLFSPASDTEPGQGGAAGIASTHHPFTAPKTASDVDLLLQGPTKVVADHYDLVVNGVELGGGSRRIHDAAVQEFILRDILQMKPERLADFAHLLEALRAGCPPHAGLALGFDRLVAVMLGKESVRDVIAFPKIGKLGEDQMVKAPSVVSEEALGTYHLRLRE
ncbi:aspartate--tRNA ligase MSD1 [Aspergillus candidus]|uniref:Putative aspartyl-tRNA synthetase n=1 Tax=Aspergillus candidus TaxID=41067 RepID=A0A2I2FDL7_ASPCN|nr:putative aspartyl-tRNA synthetase [Aspergillus candidus]PLB38694.1 putative aspartyl-tRNA synthetase [Aspergillus candidus]